MISGSAAVTSKVGAHRTGMSFRGDRLSASLVTIDLHADGTGSRMKYTEQTAFIGGADDQHQRVAGTEAGLDRLIEVMASDNPKLQRTSS